MAQIRRDNDFVVLYFMVRMLCQKKSFVFDISVNTLCIFSKDISFFSYIFLFNKDMAVDELIEDQCSDLDLNKVRKLCCE